ncbi:hypothetical protein TraAM80_02092 [Trypanosoma rangeli]|uniref:Uncharacterized protein n=1 Tax=Trypanosoma rangeli TaxID=5698 RepID=A0A3S5IS16_TRYRA|nr:uncharacterized protein TraAM80_02092 [Trypanosoma rangeli]RNF09608.1 hypothetical protein TraAM80_02092 [Trypanosoma rangeli]|eukprot:RNF09608.1 hypothetical protein TraAM80_02092 [Trypanosoma rangeli]
MVEMEAPHSSSDCDSTGVWQELPEESYERVFALARAYRQRLEVVDHEPRPVHFGEVVHSLLNNEVTRRRSLEKEEQNAMNIIMKRWTQRFPPFAAELRTIQVAELKTAEMAKERILLERQLYREQFLDFWQKEKREQLQRQPAHVDKFLMDAYKHNVLPFAADPVDCWEMGIVVPPELQQTVVLSDSKGSVSLPAFHELSMRLRAAYHQYRVQQGGASFVKGTATHDS